MNTKIKNITRVGYLIIVIAVFGVMQSYTSNKIADNEKIREEYDYQTLSYIQELFNNELEKEDVKEYIKKIIGNEGNCKLTIGKCEDKLLYNIKEYYNVLYQNISGDDLENIHFLSLNCKKNGRVCVYIYKNLKVDIAIINERGEILEGVYSDVLMIEKDTDL